MIPLPGAEPVGWAQPSTVLAAGVGAVIHDEHALKGIGLESPLAALGEHDTRCRAVRGGEGRQPEIASSFARAGLAGRRSGTGQSRTQTAQADGARSGSGCLARRRRSARTGSRSSQHDDATPTVVALPVLEGRLATLVAQLDPGRLRLYQFHPLSQPHESNDPGRMRRVEHLQRVLLGNRAGHRRTPCH